MRLPSYLQPISLKITGPAFDSGSRLMIFAPHPDDEVLGCGILLQRARSAAAAARVVYVTDGENNPWPQRFLERKYRLGPHDRRRWGQLRRTECLAALQVLGHDPSTACFLALPDQGLTALLVRGCSKTLVTLTRSIADWAPSHLFIPSATDIHPDHSALAVMLSLVLQQLRENGWSGAVWSYAIHRQSPAFSARAYPLPQSRDEAVRKMQAVYCHQTQLKLSRRRFLSYATRPELWQHIGPREAGTPEGSVRAILRNSNLLRVEIRLSMKAALLPDPILFLLGRDELDKFKCVHLRVPDRSSEISMLDAATGRTAGTARYAGNGFAGDLLLPIDLFSQKNPLFVKLVRPRLFFDEAGWSEIPPVASAERLAIPTHDVGDRLLSATR
jgi:LmbE family N-acetylglucosaminyl deacetylase